MDAVEGGRVRFLQWCGLWYGPCSHGWLYTRMYMGSTSWIQLFKHKGERWELVLGGSVGGRIERMNIIKYQRMNKINIML